MEKEDTGEKPVPSLLACIQVADNTINLPLSDSSSCSGADMYSSSRSCWAWMRACLTFSKALIASYVALNIVKYIFL